MFNKKGFLLNRRPHFANKMMIPFTSLFILFIINFGSILIVGVIIVVTSQSQ